MSSAISLDNAPTMTPFARQYLIDVSVVLESDLVALLVLPLPVRQSKA